jgi:GntR family transcriptional repressor for pyruvate dehydrogenase complex
MVTTINMLMALQDIDYREVFDLRCSYEYTALRLAIDHITPEELDEIRAILVKMDEPMSAKESASLDVAFHNMLLKASRNRLLYMYTQIISNLLNSFIEDYRTRIMMNKENAQKLRTAHWGIYLALEKGDYDAGAAAMDEHFTIVRNEMNRS